MGLLSILGETYSYQESKEFFQEIKQKGLIQFLKLCEKFSNERLHNPPVLWGDEIEFHILNMNYITKEVKLQCDIDYIYKKFEEINAKTLQEFQIQPEYGSWMLETVPMFPFTYCCDLNPVIKNMATRRKVIQALLENDDIVCSFPVFPLLGTPDSHLKKKEIINGEESKADDILMENIYKHDDKKKNGLTENHHFEHKNLITHSQFINDEIINQHPRFPTLTKNVRERRGEKVNIKIPLFIDDNTHLKVTEEEPYPGFIYMDAMAFGMGNCCLQVTFSTKDMDNARLFYDQLAVLTPLILPLTAGSPIFKGKLADIDSRWQSIVQSVDDRTFNERNPHHADFIPKSRYDTISYFIANDKKFREEYNDLNFPVQKELMEFVKKKEKEFNLEIDKNLLQHLGFLYMRDPLVIFKDNKTSESSTLDFENIQSTNWNSVRFKPPPNLDSKVNWRVEFRPMEVQITDEENALYSFLILRMLRMLSFEEFNLNFYIPMSLVDKNFERALKRNAIIEQKFFIRKNIFDDGKPEIIEVTLDTFFFGNSEFIGIEKLMILFNDFFEKKINNGNYPKEYMKKCQNQNSKLLEYIRSKTSGKKLTLASWVRKFVHDHPLYKKDSIVSKEIAFDLLKRVNDISNHKVYDMNFDCGLSEND